MLKGAVTVSKTFSRFTNKGYVKGAHFPWSLASARPSPLPNHANWHTVMASWGGMLSFLDVGNFINLNQSRRRGRFNLNIDRSPFVLIIRRFTDPDSELESATWLIKNSWSDIDFSQLIVAHIASNELIDDNPRTALSDNATKLVKYKVHPSWFRHHPYHYEERSNSLKPPPHHCQRSYCRVVIK